MPDAAALELRQAADADRVEVADGQIDRLPERQRVVGAAVGGDHERCRLERHRAHGARPGCRRQQR